jgi:hypothetical protein
MAPKICSGYTPPGRRQTLKDCRESYDDNRDICDQESFATNDTSIESNRYLLEPIYEKPTGHRLRPADRLDSQDGICPSPIFHCQAETCGLPLPLRLLRRPAAPPPLAPDT